MLLIKNTQIVKLRGCSRPARHYDAGALVIVLGIICFSLLSCHRKIETDTITITNSLSGISKDVNVTSSTSSCIEPQVRQSTTNSDYGANRVVAMSEDFGKALNTLKDLRQGHIPEAHELMDAVEHLPQEQIANIAHDLIMKNKGSVSAALNLCTNAMQRETDPGAFNRLCFLTGVAYEKLANNERDADLRATYFKEAIGFYQVVLDRVERGLSKVNAANTAFYLAYVYQRLQQYDLAEQQYNTFANYSETIDNNHDNAVFAKLQLATMLAFVDPDRAELICNTLLANEPDTRHRQLIEQTRNVFIPQGRSQLAISRSITSSGKKQ